jgi:hypothetical protein
MRRGTFERPRARLIHRTGSVLSLNSGGLPPGQYREAIGANAWWLRIITERLNSSLHSIGEDALLQSTKVTARIEATAFGLLEQHPEGLRFSELVRKIQEVDPTFKHNTITGRVWNLDAKFPSRVYKPSKGLFRLIQFKDAPEGMLSEKQTPVAVASSVREEDFYEPFAVWLKNDIEDVTRAISLGRNKFKDKWGTPDVIGLRESQRSDIIKGPTEIVSAEIKTDTAQLVTAFGQVCSYKLFSHKAYLVVPRQSSREEISRIDALCQIFGIGFVTFNAESPSAPDFQILVRPARHEPDLYYTNKYVARIEKELFS